jgi:hypothetical protein
MTYPDAPINLAENLASRSETILGLTWSDGVLNGGGEVFAYTISQAVTDGAFVELFSVMSRSATISGLTFGTTYRFKVQA